MVARLRRRNVLRYLVGSVVALVGVACGVRPTSEGAGATSAKGGEAMAGTGEILRNEDRPKSKPDWNVRYVIPFRAPDPAKWQFTVEGLVDAPRSFTLEEIMALPSVSQVSRMVCVEGWSAKAAWVGFTYRTLAALVKPRAEAKYLRFRCADGYWEHLSISDVDSPRVLFVYKMDGSVLMDKFGAPLRLIVPPKWGYKGPKALIAVEFTDAQGEGFWSKNGLYPVAGEVQAGIDRPLDLGGEAREIKGGEVTEY
jgi:DMSO/TMAO reductase YedYZ molybdopterin-dependent catalytic subunit